MANILSTKWNWEYWSKDDRSDLCEHVASGKDGYAVLCEDDSFGPLCRHVVCEACYEAAQEAEAIDPCCDCGETKKNSEMLEWLWYDFYAPQGDEPFYVCGDCWSKDKHQARIEQDNADYEAECG